MSPPQPRTSIVLVAWAILLAASLLPLVIARELLRQDLSRDARLEVAAIGIVAGLALTLAMTRLRALRLFFVLLRSMLETRGLAWAWFIHFVQDVAIFSFMAIGAITPGGG